jgi:hypothetical protein
MPRRAFGYSAIAFIVLAAACSDPTVVRAPGGSAPSRTTAEQSALGDAGNAHRQYGPAVKIGNGIVRTYVLRNKSSDTPLEIGVALSEDAMEGLPAPMAMSGTAAAGHDAGHAHVSLLTHVLTMPTQNPTPYQFVELNWNPAGHEPAGVYDLPHFDFHFWTASRELRASILPTDPQYAQQAANLPANEYRSPFYVDAATAAGAPAGAVSVPLMGLHWLDVRSPELQGMTGHPEAYRPFTTTFIYGSWNGQFVFAEPMITRAYIMAKRDATDPAVRDEVIPVSAPPHATPAGFYPTAYRIAYDAAAREYRIALTQLAPRQ